MKNTHPTVSATSCSCRRWPTPSAATRFQGTARTGDMSRQRILERAGWTFWRCFASTWCLREHRLTQSSACLRIAKMCALLKKPQISQLRSPRFSGYMATYTRFGGYSDCLSATYKRRSYKWSINYRCLRRHNGTQPTCFGGRCSRKGGKGYGNQWVRRVPLFHNGTGKRKIHFVPVCEYGFTHSDHGRDIRQLNSI